MLIGYFEHRGGHLTVQSNQSQREAKLAGYHMEPEENRSEPSARQSGCWWKGQGQRLFPYARKYFPSSSSELATGSVEAAVPPGQ